MPLKDEMKFVNYREDLPFLLNRLGLKGEGVEIGVQRGEFSAHVLSYWEGKKLYLIDAWRHFDSDYKDIANLDHNGQLDCMAKTFMAVYGFKEKVSIIRDLSVSAASLFKDASLDFVFNDGNHSYEAVVADIAAWAPKVKSGGLLCGHDYLNSAMEENKMADFGVKRAVDEFVEKNKLELHSDLQFQLVMAAQTKQQGHPIACWFLQME